MVRKNSKFKTICKVSRAFGTTYSQEELLDLIVQSAIDTMGGKAACLFLFNLEKNESVPVAQKGLSENYLHSKRRDAMSAISLLNKHGYISIPDVATLPDRDNPDSKKAEGIASLLIVPVKAKDKVLGMLVLYMADPTDFSQDEIDFLTALAEQGGMAIKNARLVERIRESTRLFYDFTSNINSSLDIKKIMLLLSADMTKAFGVKGVAIRLLDEQKESLKLVASHGLSEKFLKKGPISAKASVAQALEGEPIVIKDAVNDDQIQYKKEMKEEGIVSMLCVPIKAKEEVIGVMRLYSDVEREFTEDEISMISALGHQGGLAIRNASLYLLLQRDMKELQEDEWSHRSWF